MELILVEYTVYLSMQTFTSDSSSRNICYNVDDYTV